MILQGKRANSETEATVLFVEKVLKISKDYEVAIHEDMNKGGEDEGKSHLTEVVGSSSPQV